MTDLRFAVVVFVSAAATSTAHEFWIEPATFHCAENTVVPVQAWLGERFDGKVVRRDERRIESFRTHGPERTTDVQGRSGGGASYARVHGEGVYVLGYQGRPVEHRMDAAAFDAYLRTEGLEHIVREREQRGESDREGRERFARCAKSLVTVGSGPPAGFDRAAGLSLEITPLTSPFSMNDALVRIRVTFERRPIGNTKLVAVNRDALDRMIDARTDDDGCATLTLDRPGAWLITTVHMQRETDGEDVEWESFWGSLTFERGPSAEDPSVP